MVHAGVRESKCPTLYQSSMTKGILSSIAAQCLYNCLHISSVLLITSTMLSMSMFFYVNGNAAQLCVNGGSQSHNVHAY